MNSLVIHLKNKPICWVTSGSSAICLYTVSKVKLKCLAVIFLAICFIGQHKSHAQQCGNLIIGDTVYVTSALNGGGSLSSAINCVNSAGSLRFIHFDIDDPGVITITPTGANPLPNITKNDIVLDARTQPGWYLGKVVISGSVFSSTTHGINAQANGIEIYGLTITGYTNTSAGGGIYLQGSDAIIEQNALIGNRYGIHTASPPSFTARNNMIGVDPVTDAGNGNSVAGINILTSALGVFEIENNTIAYNPTGILAASPFVEVLVSENSLFCNPTKGIERSGFSVSGFAMNTATPNAISGTGPNGAFIEVFIHDNSECIGFTAPCQGKTFLGATNVSGGNWTLNLPPDVVQAGDQVTATATIAGNNTSEFLSCFTVTCPSADVVFSDVQNACGTTNSGSATASVSIAGDFSYEWSDGQTNATAINLTPGGYSVVVTDMAGCAYTGSVVIDSSPMPSANPFGTTPLCVGDTLLVESNANGGTPPYNYSWNGPDGYVSDQEFPIRTDIQLSESGTYSLTVTDTNGCEDIANTFVEVNDAPSFNLIAQAISCNGAADGSIDLTPISTTLPVIYSWSNAAETEDIDNLGPGIYTVVVTDGNGCSFSDSRTIIEPTAIIISNLQSTSPSMLGANDGSFSFNINGGTGPYNYSWTGPANGNASQAAAGNIIINNLPAGDYILSLTDANDCSINRAFTIVAFSCDFFIEDSNVDHVRCAGELNGQIDITLVNGIEPITYNWDNGAMTEDISGLAASTYALTATDASGCMIFFNATVMEPPPLFINNVQSNPPSMMGGNDGSFSFNINGGTAPYSYSWTGPANGNASQAAPGNVIINNLPAGDYSLLLTDNNGCITSRPFIITAFNCNFFIEDSNVDNVRCAGEMNGQISITLVNGVEPITYNWDNGAMTEDINGLAAGTYALTATDASGCMVFFSGTVMEPLPLVINNVQSNSPSMMGGNDGSFSFNINGGTAPYNYSWTGPVGGNANQATPGNVVIDNLPAGDYNLSLTDANDCNLSRAFTISNANCNLTIVAEIINNESCAGEMNGTISLTIDNGISPYSYNWTNGVDNGNGAGTNIINLTAAIYDITITDQNNCVISTTLEVDTNSLPIPGTTTSSSCDEGNGTAIFDLTALEITINPNPDLSIIWFEDAAGTMQIATPANYTTTSGLVYAATSEGNCISSLVSIQLVVLPPNDPVCMTSECETFAGTFSNSETQTVCSDFSAVDFYNNDAILDVDDALVFILHTLAGENLGTILSVRTNPTASFDAENMEYGVTYYLSAAAGNSNGMDGIDLNDSCLSVSAGQAVIFSESLSGVLNFIQGEEVLCQGEDLFLSTNVLSGIDPNYHWIQPNGDTIITTTANMLIENIQPLNAGDYYVFIQDESCLFDQTGPFTLTVLGLALGEEIDAGNDTTICDHQFTLNAAPISSGNGFWMGPTGVLISNPNEATTAVSELRDGINQFIWTVNTSDCGTIGSDTLNLVVADGLQAEDDFFTLAQANSEIFMDVLKNDGLADETAYTLEALSQPEFGSLLTLDNGFQYFEPEGQRGVVTFEYEICYTNGNCASSCATATVTIDVLNLPYLPEGFTPNNDGKNDRLAVLGYIGGGDISMKIQITNRWGDIVYYSDNYLLETPWDGHLNNSKETLAEGTYYAWIEITVDGVVYQQSQALYLIK